MSTPDRIEGIELKIERAKAHIRDLHELLERFFKTNPYEAVRSENDSKPGDLTYYLRIHQDPPPEIGLIVGDAIHNLRSSLDHLAVQLVEAGGGAVTEGTCFPILSKPPASAQELEARVKEKVQGARKEAIALVAASEPYEGGNGHPLWVLHRLDIRDKHHLVIPAWTGYRSFGLNLTFPGFGEGPIDVPPVYLRPKDRGPMKDGHPLLHIAAAARTEYEREPDFRIEIAVHEPGIVECEPILVLLAQLAEFVERTIEPFRALL